MKKLVVLCVSATLALGLSACAKEEKPEEGATNQAIENGTTQMVTEEDVDGEGFVTESLYGKVTSVVGNEIELALAKEPEMPEVDMGDTNVTEIGDGMVAVTLTAATPAGELGDMAENMEFTGESMTITIPTGTKIYSAGQEATVTAIKKGSIVSMSVDNFEDMNIDRLDVLQ